jgi:hypothetical protein
MSDVPLPQAEQPKKPKGKSFSKIPIRKATGAEASLPTFDAEQLDMKPSSAEPVVTVVRGLFGKKSAQAAAKPAAKPKAKPVEQAPGDLKLKKPKLVRDSFTFPKDEYQAIAGLKQKALGLKHSAKKSEILRAGLMLLNALNDKAFLAALAKVPALKTGRPAKS